MGSSEEVAERVIQQVDERCGIEVSITHHLAGKEGLPGATAKQASHHPIAHVHVMSYFLNRRIRLSAHSKTYLCTGYVPVPVQNEKYEKSQTLFCKFSPKSHLDTLIRLWMELMSGRSLLLLSRCLETNEKSSENLSRKDISYT